jgi:hypothetical protein
VTEGQSSEDGPASEAGAVASRAEAASYYVWPLVWLGAPPDDLHSRVEPGEAPPDVDVRQLAEVVAEAELPGAIRARAYRDGMFMFDFSQWAPFVGDLPGADFDELAALVLRRVGLMNAHLACFYTSVAKVENRGLEVTALTPSLILPTNSFDEPEGVGLPDARVGWIHMARYESQYNPSSFKQIDSRLSMRIPIELAAVEDSFRRLGELLDHNASERVIALADLLTRSGAAYSAHDYNVALVTAWTLSESLLQELWLRYLEENRERTLDTEIVSFINRDRLDFLTGRDMTARLVSEVLSLVDRLPFTLYPGLNAARSARNKWVHDLSPVSHQTAATAIETAEQMLAHVDGVELLLPKGLGLQI